MGSQFITLTEFIWDVLDRSDDAKQLSSALDLQECLKKRWKICQVIFY